MDVDIAFGRGSMTMIRTILSAAPERGYRASALGVLLLALSFVSLLTAPLLMPESYSWLSHTTSESAAQVSRAAG
jgi:hypothetical protein